MADMDKLTRTLVLMENTSESVREGFSPRELATIATILCYLDDRYGVTFGGIDDIAYRLEDWLNESEESD